MLKKAGILAGVVAAGLLAVSPLAFASGKDHGGYGGHEGDRYSYTYDRSDQINAVDSSRNSEQNGLVNVGDVNALNDLNVCPGIPVAAGLGNVLGILGTGVANPSATNGDITCVNDDSTTLVNER